MIKNLWKKAGAVFLAMMLSLSVMPMSNVFAAGGTYSADDLQSGDVLNTGDIVDKGSAEKFGSIVYLENANGSGADTLITSPASPHTIGTYWGYTKWYISSINKSNNAYQIILVAKKTADITVTNDGNGTASADVSEAKEGDTVTLSAVPNTGYKFKEWQSDDVTVTNNQFTMPNKAVSVKAIFEIDDSIHHIEDLQVGDVLKTGDTVDVIPPAVFGKFIYFENPDGSGGVKPVSSPASPYTVESYYGHTKWVVSSASNSGIGAGSYNVALKPFVETATVDDVTVSGAKDVALATATITVNTNVSISISADADVTSWFTNMPAGLTAKVSTVGTDSVDIQITGTPTAISSEAMQIKIPASAFGGSEDLEVTSNANAKFDIVERKASINAIEIKGVVGEAVDKDITVTLTNDELNVGHMDLSKRPTSNLPNGISLGYGSSSDKYTFKISVYGTPTAIGNGTLELTIPGEWLKSGKALKVTANSNAKYDFAKIKITAGAGSTHKTGINEDLTFTCNGSLANLTGIYVDGALLDPSNYTTKSGSTILTLKAGYLNTLAVGTHTLKFQYKNDMSANTSFEIVKAEDEKKPPVNNPVDKNGTPITDTGKTNSPQTGDTTNIALLMSLLVLSGGAVAFVSKKRKTATKR